MAATEITTSSGDIASDFDLVVRGNFADVRKQVVLKKALGAGGTNFEVCKVFNGVGHHFVKNTGTNAFKLEEAIAGVTVEWNNT